MKINKFSRTKPRPFNPVVWVLIDDQKTRVAMITDGYITDDNILVAVNYNPLYHGFDRIRRTEKRTVDLTGRMDLQDQLYWIGLDDIKDAIEECGL